MRATVLTTCALLLTAGCVTTPTPPAPTAGERLKAQYPVGYKRLAKLVPACAEPTDGLTEDCTLAARILQSQPREAVSLLLTHVEAVGGQLATAAEGERTRRWTQFQEVVVPATKQTLTNIGDTYSKAVLSAMDALDVASESAAELLRQANAAAQKAATLLD